MVNSGTLCAAMASFGVTLGAQVRNIMILGQFLAAFWGTLGE